MVLCAAAATAANPGTEVAQEAAPGVGVSPTVQRIVIQSRIVQNPEFRNQRSELPKRRKENDLAATTDRWTMYEQTIFRRGAKPTHVDDISWGPGIDRNSCIVDFLEAAECCRKVG